MSKFRFNAPRDSEEAALMNTRIQQKKKRHKEGRKPQNKADFIYESKQMIKWFYDNPDIRNFLTYADRHGFTWSQFKRWRRESEEFSQAIETCLQICLERREIYLDQKNKLSSVYITEQPVYNPLLAEYEKSMKLSELKEEQEKLDAFIDTQKLQPIITHNIAKTKELDEHEKEKKNVSLVK